MEKAGNGSNRGQSRQRGRGARQRMGGRATESMEEQHWESSPCTKEGARVPSPARMPSTHLSKLLVGPILIHTSRVQGMNICRGYKRVNMQKSAFCTPQVTSLACFIASLRVTRRIAYEEPMCLHGDPWDS